MLLLAVTVAYSAQASLTRAQLLLRWLRNVVTSRIFAFKWAIPLFNALILSNLWEYHHKTLCCEKLDFGLRFRRTHYA